MDFNDTQLVTAYLKGDEKAFEILIARHLKPVYNFVRRLVSETAAAEDITQDVFIRAWRNLKKFDQNKNFRTWLFAIAKNAAFDFLRRKKSFPFSDFEDEAGENALVETLVDPAPLPSELLDRQDLARRAVAAIAELPAKYRAVLSLHYDEQLTFQEIADVLSEPLNTVKSRHLRAIIALRKIIVGD